MTQLHLRPDSKVRHWFLGTTQTKTLRGDRTPYAAFPVTLLKEDLLALDNLLERAERIAQHAESKQVSMMVDAEQSYFQPAIDLVSTHLSLKYNRKLLSSGLPLVYNTYQMYLKEGLHKLKTDLYLHQHAEGTPLGIKMVRGAYMTTEALRAERLGVVNPIFATKQEVDRQYDAGARLVLETMANEKAASNAFLVIASHNPVSLDAAVKMIDASTTLALRRNVAFGQLLGMSDHLTATLASRGLCVYKYVPYGQVRETVCFLCYFQECSHRQSYIDIRCLIDAVPDSARTGELGCSRRHNRRSCFDPGRDSSTLVWLYLERQDDTDADTHTDEPPETDSIETHVLLHD
jgi:hypothetical protein